MVLSIYYPYVLVDPFISVLAEKFMSDRARKKKDAAAIDVLEFYFSHEIAMTNSYLQSLMNASLWVPLEELLSFSMMYALRVSTFEHLLHLAAKSIINDSSTNLELDSTGTLVRPKWAKWSSITYKITFSPAKRRSMDRKQKLARAKRILHEALESVRFTQQIAHEPEDIEIVMFGVEKDRSVTANFNAPGIPSLIKPFINEYNEKGVTGSVIECVDSMLFSAGPLLQSQSEHEKEKKYNDGDNKEEHVQAESALKKPAQERVREEPYQKKTCQSPKSPDREDDSSGACEQQEGGEGGCSSKRQQKLSPRSVMGPETKN